MTADTASAPVRLDVWADLACPWCYLGTVRLENAVTAAAAEGEQVVIRHKPFQLNPDLPESGVPMAGYLEARLGGAEQVRAAHARLTEMGREAGIAYDFEAVGKAPNTRLAHHLLSTYDGDARQRPAVLALYRAYFSEGRDITDADTLVAVVSATTGEAPDDVRERLARPTDAVEAEFRLGRTLGVSAVPTFVADAGTDIDPQVGLSAAAVAVQGAQSEDVLRQVLGEARRRAGA